MNLFFNMKLKERIDFVTISQNAVYVSIRPFNYSSDTILRGIKELGPTACNAIT